MKRAWRLLSKPDLYFLLSVIFVTVLAGRSLIFESGYFNMHDDLQMMRQLQLEKCFEDGQIPCRWVPDMGYGYGFPLFNFYPQLPYLIGQIFRVIGLSFVTTANFTFALSFIFSGIFMYLLGKEFFGRLGGLLSATFYTWAPYHSVDIYVRGAMNEAWAMVWFPAILWAGYKLIVDNQEELSLREANTTKQSLRYSWDKSRLPRSLRSLAMTLRADCKWIILLAIFWFALLNSHNLMVMIFAPVFAFWVLILLWQKDAWRKIPSFIVTGIWALGLSAFFTLPVLFEQKYTQVDQIIEGYYDYNVHFTNLSQLFISRYWGYEGSEWGVENDGMSFQVGHLHWILSLVVLIMIFYWLLKKRSSIKNYIQKNKFILTTFFMLAVGWFSIFMTHARSYFIWDKINILHFLQFPWRFLIIAIFALSFSVGAIPKIISSNKRFLNFALTPFRTSITLILVLLVIIINWNYFRPEGGQMGPLTDEEKFSGLAWVLQQKASILDYLPTKVKTPPESPRERVVDIIHGKGEISNISTGTNWLRFDTSINSEDSTVRINIFDFPDWRVFADDEQIKHYVAETDEYGRIHLDLSEGEYSVYAILYDTPIRKYGNLISTLSWIFLISLTLKKLLLSRSKHKHA